VQTGIVHDFHLSWVFRPRDALNKGVLPPTYYALAEQRAGAREPDVIALTRSEPPADLPENPGFQPAQYELGTLALLDAPPKVTFVDDLDDEYYVRKRRTIAIRHVTGNDLVALVEIMSPGNKSSQSHLEQFVEKVILSLQTGIHVLIVDIHPQTSRDPKGIHAVIAHELGREVTRFEEQKPLSLVSYRVNGETRAFVEPVAGGDQLTPMPLFLSEQRYVYVPLEETYKAAFDSVPRHLQAMLAGQS
jgi:hypothetical protein